MRGSKKNPAGKPLRSTDLAMLSRTSSAPSYFVDIVDTRYSPPRVLEARVRRTDASATIALARSEKMRFIKLRAHRVNPSPKTVAGNLEPYLRGVTIPAGFAPDFNNNDNTPRYWNKQLRLALFVGHHDQDYRDSHDEGSHRFQVVRTDDDGDLGEYKVALETSDPRVLAAWLRGEAARAKDRQNPVRRRARRPR
jgi:hypothetical protein